MDKFTVTTFVAKKVAMSNFGIFQFFGCQKLKNMKK